MLAESDNAYNIKNALNNKLTVKNCWLFCTFTKLYCSGCFENRNLNDEIKTIVVRFLISPNSH